MTIEFIACAIAALVIAVFYFISAGIKSRTHMLHTGLISTIVGAMMIFLGWWGSDAAFCSLLGGNETVYVAFMRTYTVLEWWNINWFITTIGTVLLSLGTLIIGRVFRE